MLECGLVEIEGEQYHFWRYPPPDPFVAIVFPSLTQPDEEHTVIIQGKKIDCSCRGFLYSHHCRHVDLVRALTKELR